MEYDCTRSKLFECRVKITRNIAEEVEGERPECASWRAKRADRQKMHDLSSRLNNRARRRKQQGTFNSVKTLCNKNFPADDIQGFQRTERWRPRWAQRDTQARKQVDELTINERNNDTIYFQGLLIDVANPQCITYHRISQAMST